ncbi:PAS domain-containing protein [Clostridiaceae bacterium 35-E11]
MCEKEIVLTKTDLEILNSYKEMVVGLGSYLGSGYEITVHSLEDFHHSVVQIINGHYSGRNVGSPITDFALSMLSKIERSDDKTAITYFNKNKNNVLLKSTTIPILGENERIIGLLCINFYTNIPLSDILCQLIPQDATNEETKSIENFTDDIDDLILNALNEVKKEVLDNPSISSSNKNKEIIISLEHRGIFNIKDSISKIADLLNISKNTVYMHLRNLKNQE